MSKLKEHCDCISLKKPFVFRTFVDRCRVHVVRLLLLLRLRPDDPVREGEGERAKDPAVEEGDHGQDEGPADAAVALGNKVNFIVFRLNVNAKCCAREQKRSRLNLLKGAACMHYSSMHPK